MQTRTPGITIDAAGRRLIDKEHNGIRICARLGRVSQYDAEERLRTEMALIDAKLQSDFCRRPRFLDRATRYLAESRFERSARVIDWHVRLLNTHIGHLEIDRVHDGTLAAFVADGHAAKVSATTINRGLEVVRTVLNRAARVYRDDAGRHVSLTRSLGRNRIGSFRCCRRIWDGWCCSP